MANTQARDSEARDAELVELFFKGKTLGLEQQRELWARGIPLRSNEGCFEAWKSVGRILYDDSPEYKQTILSHELHRQDRAALDIDVTARSQAIYAG